MIKIKNTSSTLEYIPFDDDDDIYSIPANPLENTARTVAMSQERAYRLLFGNLDALALIYRDDTAQNLPMSLTVLDAAQFNGETIFRLSYTWHTGNIISQWSNVTLTPLIFRASLSSEKACVKLKQHNEISHGVLEVQKKAQKVHPDKIRGSM